jgi:integrase
MPFRHTRNVDGSPISPRRLGREWLRTCEAVGLPRVMFHALRHTHASALIAAGLDVVVISRRLGHANPTVTLNIYGRSDPAAAAAIEIIFGTRMER